MVTSWRWENFTEEQKERARAQAKRNWYLRQQGQGGYVDATEMQQRIRKLHDEHQISLQRIAEKAGLDTGVIKQHYRGRAWRSPEPLTQCTWRVHNAIMTTPYGPADVCYMIRSLATQRRLQALVVAGYPQSWLGPATGRSHAQLNDFMVKERRTVLADWATTVEQVHRKYIDTDPLDVGVSKHGKSYSINIGKKRGYVPATCWDDDTIDDPDAAPEWTGACGTEEGYRIHLREEIAMCAACKTAVHGEMLKVSRYFSSVKLRILMEGSGVDQNRLAKEVGVTVDTIRRWSSGERNPQGKYLDEVCQALGCERDDLYAGEGEDIVRDIDFNRQVFIVVMEEKGMGVSALAKELGVSNMAVHYWRNGKNLPKIPKIHKAAEVLGVDWKVFYQ